MLRESNVNTIFNFKVKEAEINIYILTEKLLVQEILSFMLFVTVFVKRHICVIISNKIISIFKLSEIILFQFSNYYKLNYFNFQMISN